ncbi:MAG TPA: EAL domain-containing protein [Dokdonella sp.]
MPARDLDPHDPNRQRLLRMQLPQRLAWLRERGERLCAGSWDINAIVVLRADAALLAAGCAALGEDAWARPVGALDAALAPLTAPPQLPDQATATRIAALVAELPAPSALQRAGAAGAVVVEGPTHEDGFPLLVAPPPDYAERFAAAAATPSGADTAPAASVDDDASADDAYRVMIVATDRAELESTAAVLRRAGMRTHAIGRPLAALDELERFRPELILMDRYMPECDGVDLRALIRQRDAFAAVPVVFLGEEAGGAPAAAPPSDTDGLLAKPVHADDLVMVVGERVRRARGESGADRAAPALPAADALLQQVAACLVRGDARTRDGGLLRFELDAAADLRARLGAPRIAALLARAGALLAAHAGPHDRVAQAPDGALLLFDADCEPALLESYALRLRERLVLEALADAPPDATIGFDVGVCPFVAGAASADAMHDAARDAIRAAAADGRHGVFVVRDAATNADAELVERIRDALDGGGLRLLFQPIVSLRGEEDEQFQALLRLEAGDGRVHSAAEVVPAAERGGLIGAIDRWVVEHCVERIGARARHGRTTRLFVNQSLTSLRDAEAPARLAAALARHGVAAAAVSIELRAADVAAAPAEAARYADALRALGVPLTLSGFDEESDAAASALPLAFVKLSPRALQGDDEPSRDALRALVARAHERGWRVVAPRVEDVRGASALWKLDIDFVQGNFVQAADRELAFDFRASAT